MKLGAEKGELILYVSDMEAAVEFWSVGIGLEVLSPAPAPNAWKDEHWVVLEAGSFNLCLHSGGSFQTESVTSFSLMAADFEASLDNLTESGILHSGILNPHPGVVFAEVRDPDGRIFFIKPSLLA